MRLSSAAFRSQCQSARGLAQSKTWRAFTILLWALTSLRDAVEIRAGASWNAAVLCRFPIAVPKRQRTGAVQNLAHMPAHFCKRGSVRKSAVHSDTVTLISSLLQRISGTYIACPTTGNA